MFFVTAMYVGGIIFDPFGLKLYYIAACGQTGLNVPNPL